MKALLKNIGSKHRKKIKHIVVIKNKQKLSWQKQNDS